MAGLRGWLFLRFGVSGGDVWLASAAILLVCAVILRYRAQYSLTSHRVIVRSGYTGREIHAMAISDIREVTITPGRLAQFLGIGTLVLHSMNGDRLLSLCGISDPEVIKARIEALTRQCAPAHCQDRRESASFAEGDVRMLSGFA